MTILVILSAFEAFGTDASKHPPGVWTKIFVFLALYVILIHTPSRTYSLPFNSPDSFLRELPRHTHFLPQKVTSLLPSRLRGRSLQFSIIKATPTFIGPLWHLPSYPWFGYSKVPMVSSTIGAVKALFLRTRSVRPLLAKDEIDQVNI
jgi:hypothetical protein